MNEKGDDTMLNNIKVLSFTHFLQGPSAVQMLADTGADVIKVEPAHGAWERQWAGFDAFVEGVSVFFMLANRNQRSISLDLQTPKGREIAQRLAAEADVLIENYRPGVMDKLGLAYDTLSRLNPRLVYCSCTGYGSSGPYLKRPGQDLLLQAMSGLTTLSGDAKAGPVPVGSAIVDQHAAVLAAFGVVAALYERESTGKGKKVESNLLNAAMDLQIEPFCYYMNKGPLWDRASPAMGSRFHGAPYGVYQTADHWIALSISPIPKLAQVLDRPDLLQYGERGGMTHRQAVHAAVGEALRTQTTEHWMAVFDAEGVWYAPVNDYAQVETDPQVLHNEVILPIEYPGAGTIRVLQHPVRYDGQAPALRRVPPRLGEHTEEVLREAGYSEAQISAWLEEGVAKSCDAGVAQ
ncbi:Probable racemase [plant metagenome]|uniref:Probable racemase n=2 Tax=plant metagenome TaxID=1297885 RepID=A0A484P2E7_9ZZZZ